MQAVFRKFDFKAIALGFLLTLVICGLLTFIVSLFLINNDPGFFGSGGPPKAIHPSPGGRLIGVAMILVSSLCGSFLTARIAESAPVFNALVIPAAETLRTLCIIAIGLMLGQPIVSEWVPLWLLLARPVLLIAFSYLGAMIAIRFRPKTQPA